MNQYAGFGAVSVKPATSRERVIMILLVNITPPRDLHFPSTKICLGAERDHTDTFKTLRKPTVDKAFLEISRLEKRLTRLTQLLAGLPLEQVQSKRWAIGWQTDQRKALEQSVVSWQDDVEVSNCPFCQQEFSAYTFRRHHCRTCGRVVCGDPATECSSLISLDVAKCMFDYIVCLIWCILTIKAQPRLSEKPAPDKINLDVRLCKDCKTTIFSKRDFMEDIAKEPPDVRAYKNLVQFERGIRLLLPRFHKILAALQFVSLPSHQFPWLFSNYIYN